MVNIRDVAKLANVSVATVSHVINRSRYVSPSLIKAVEDAIAELGYEPHKQKPNSYKKRSILFLIQDFQDVYKRQVSFPLNLNLEAAYPPNIAHKSVTATVAAVKSRLFPIYV